MKRDVILRAAAAAYIIIVYAALYMLYPEAFALKPSPLLLASFSLAVIAEVLRGVRLALLYSDVGGSISYHKGVKARFIGNIVALLTPSVAGGEVVRGLVLHGGIEAEAIPAIGVAAIDRGLDLIGNYILAIIALVSSAAPTAPLPEMLALAPFLAWTGALALVSSGRFARLASRAAAALRDRGLLARIADWISRLERLHIRPRTIATALTLTMVAWLFESMSYAILASIHPLLACGCVAELMLMGIIPTPGGIGPGEALLAQSCPGIAAWRMVYLAAATLPAIPALLATKQWSN